MEELNQVQTNSESVDNSDINTDGFLDDWDDSTPADSSSAEELSDSSSDIDANQNVNEEEEQETVTQNETVPPFLTVKFNKEEKGLTQEETIAYAQKGMNYDHMKEKYDSINDSYNSLFNRLNTLAQQNGLDVDQYMDGLAQTQANFRIAQEVEALKLKYPNAEEEALTEMATLMVNDRNKQSALEAQNKQKESQQARANEIGRQLDIFTSRYPDVDPHELGSDVYNLMANGYTMLEAYETVQAQIRAEADKQKEIQEKADRLNQSNKKKSIGNTANVQTADSDPFLAGWNS